VRRAVIVQQEVISEVKPGNIGYVKLTGFSEHAADQLTKVVGDDIKAGRTKLILDLRGNPGGFVTAAREIASQFVSTGPIFWQQDAAGNLTETDAEAGGAATDADVQLVVLIDKGSASASEIVAGALQDWDAALIVGETSFGKGSVQTVYPLSDTEALKLTTAKYYTPSGRCIHRDERDHEREEVEVSEAGAEGEGEEHATATRPPILQQDDRSTKSEAPDTTTTFRTVGGRPVKGGGGIVPDLVLTQPNLSDFAVDLAWDTTGDRQLLGRQPGGHHLPRDQRRRVDPYRLDLELAASVQPAGEAP